MRTQGGPVRQGRRGAGDPAAFQCSGTGGSANRGTPVESSGRRKGMRLLFV